MSRQMKSVQVIWWAATLALTGSVGTLMMAQTAPRPLPTAEDLLKQSSGPLETGPTATAPAADRGGRGGPGNIEASVVRAVRSPEVDADHKITFRVAAPNARRVQLQGDFTVHSDTVIDMTNDGNGVWSYTTSALKPSTYQYWFMVDGQQTPDPVNTYVRPASGVYKSMVDVPGPGMEFMAFREGKGFPDLGGRDRIHFLLPCQAPNRIAGIFQVTRPRLLP